MPSIGLVGAPKKKQLFYSYGKGESYLIKNNQTVKNECLKKTPKGEIIALASYSNPSEIIMN